MEHKVEIYTDGACSRKSGSAEAGERFCCMEKIEKKFLDIEKIRLTTLWK